MRLWLGPSDGQNGRREDGFNRRLSFGVVQLALVDDLAEALGPEGRTSRSAFLRSAIGDLRSRIVDLDVRVGLTVRPGSARLPFYFTRASVNGVQALGVSFDIDLSF